MLYIPQNFNIALNMITWFSILKLLSVYTIIFERSFCGIILVYIVHMLSLPEGKWILPASYVEESYRQNKWLDEELFEWSAKDAEENPASQYLYSLPRKWREKYKSHRGAFRKWIVVLVFKSQKKKDGFKRYVYSKLYVYIAAWLN